MWIDSVLLTVFYCTLLLTGHFHGLLYWQSFDVRFILSYTVVSYVNVAFHSIEKRCS